MVGQALAEGFTRAGYDVTIGTRDVDAALARTAPTPRGAPGFGDWHSAHPGIGVTTIAEAAEAADIIVLAVAGANAPEALSLAEPESLTGTTVIDVTNPLVFAPDALPSLSVVNTDSIGELLQRTFPEANVVKTLNTVTAPIMIDPKSLDDGNHTMFVAGNDAGAKDEVRALLIALGWHDLLDLGDITAARGMEMYLPLWLRMRMAFDSPMFSIKVVR